MPTISVIVPVYKAEQYLHCCVDSILSQTFEDFELILVDDGSPDNSGTICDEYAEKDKRVRAFHQENKGQAAARNYGVSIANGEWICFVDSDDAIHPQMLACLYDAVKSTHALIAVCDVMRASECPAWKLLQDTEQTVHHSDNEETMLMWLTTGHQCYWIPCAKLIHSSLLQQYPFPEGRIYEDNAVVFKWLHEAKVVVDCHTPCYWYRHNPESTTQTGFSVKRLDYLWATEEQICFYSERGYETLSRFFCNEYFKMVISNYNNMKAASMSEALIKKMVKESKRVYRCNRKAVTLTEYEYARLQQVWHPHTYKLREKLRQLF